MRLPASAHRAAASTLTDWCTITRPGTGEWTPDGGLPTTATQVWCGPCSLSPTMSTGGRRSDFGGDDNATTSEVLRVPDACHGGPADAREGDRVTIANMPGREWVVMADLARTTGVLARLRLVDVRNMQGVPK